MGERQIPLAFYSGQPGVSGIAAGSGRRFRAILKDCPALGLHNFDIDL